jgi:hypothetical protein
MRSDITEQVHSSGTPTTTLAGGNALSVSPKVVRIGLSGLRISIR